MTKTHAYFLIGGFLFGTLFGAALINYLDHRPDPMLAGGSASAMQPRGPSAPTQIAGGAQASGGAPAAGAPMAQGGGGAPMMATINNLKRELQDDPNNVELLTRLANIYHDVSMWDQAVTFYGRAVAQKPDDPDLLTDMGVCLRNMGQQEKALELFDRAHEAAPEHWQALFNTVIVAGFDLGEYDRAEKALDAMARLNPPPPKLDELRSALEQRRAGAS